MTDTQDLKDLATLSQVADTLRSLQDYSNCTLTDIQRCRETDGQCLNVPLLIEMHKALENLDANGYLTLADALIITECSRRIALAGD